MRDSAQKPGEVGAVYRREGARENLEIRIWAGFQMQVKIISIPSTGDAAAESELNSFLSSHRVLKVERIFTPYPSGGGEWCFCVEHINGAPSAADGGDPGARNWKAERVDYRKVLSDDEFRRFYIYRECRKELAAQDAVPPFFVFKDEQLAEMARLTEPLSAAALKKIKGVGDGKITKYAERLITLATEKERVAGDQVSAADENETRG